MSPRPAGPQEGTARRLDASMSLLTEVMNQPLDPGYAAAAQRRRELGVEEPPRGRSLLTILTVLVLGALLATAWWQARGTRPAGVQAREQLAAEITRQDAAAGSLQRSNAALLAQIEAERRRQLQLSAQGDLAQQVSDLALATGALSVAGPGITVTLNDAKPVGEADGSDPRTQTEQDEGRVLDQDVQLVVNGLWGAGAEAVAINGQRLTALSAIRSAGLAILVDYRPLTPPYKISAIGDPNTLETRFSNGPGGRDIQYLKDNFGVRASIASAKRLVLPASAGLDTRRAKAVRPHTQTPTPTSSTPSTAPSKMPSRPQETQ